MPTYKVYYTKTVYNVGYLEADSPSEAWEKAEMGEFCDTKETDSGGLMVDEVEELEE